MKFPIKLAKDLLVKGFGKAKEILSDKEKIKKLLDESEEKLNKVPGFGEKLSKLPLFISMLNDYFHKDYTYVSRKTIIVLVATLVYCVAPIDFIFDKIPLIGLIDDAAVLSFAYSLIKDDFEKYRDWKEKHKTKRKATIKNTNEKKLSVKEKSKLKKTKKKTKNSLTGKRVVKK